MSEPIRVAQLWRYPVKSMRGEQLDQAALTENGVDGDRVAHVFGTRGVITARTRSRLLGLSGTLDPEGVPLVEGRSWDDSATTELVRAVAGTQAQIARYDGPERFDVLPLLIATDGAISEFGQDTRRLRPNIVLSGVPGLAERSWPGRALRIGDALIGVQSVRRRCIVTTIDPDTGEQDLDVLRDINNRFDGRMALDCWVVRGGLIRIGDRADVVDLDTVPPIGGGWITGVPYSTSVQTTPRS